jgi:peptidoglycan hydrolase-like protein with peptidoglycan-binding domain
MKKLLTVIVFIFLMVMFVNVANGSIKYGDKGNIVSLYQDILVDNGYMLIKNGIFDKQMKAAVIAYQRDNFLVPDGIIGKKTETSMIYKMFPNISEVPSSEKEEVPELLGLIYFNDKSQEVPRIKSLLKEKGFLSKIHNSDDCYDRETLKAVLAFQKANGLVEDGIVGIKTRSCIYEIPLENLKQGSEQAAMLLNSSWNMAKNSFAMYKEAVIMDVMTGKSFKVKRTGGVLHADVEPLTKEDTEKFKSIVKSWSWERRSITIDWGYGPRIASCNANPHGYDSIVTNGFSGHFCIHFINSKGHGSGIVDPAHQRAIENGFISIFGTNFKGYEVVSENVRFIPSSRSFFRKRVVLQEQTTSWFATNIFATNGIIFSK